MESHTDNSPISPNSIKNNWDLSAKRTTAITRLLQTGFDVQPDRILAGGRSEYTPKEYAGTKPNKKLNWRIENTIMPKLDQFFRLWLMDKWSDSYQWTINRYQLKLCLKLYLIFNF